MAIENQIWTHEGPNEKKKKSWTHEGPRKKSEKVAMSTKESK
jgi:hypothetical protein